MQFTRRKILAASGASIALAGCTSDGEPTPTEDEPQDGNAQDGEPETPTPDDTGSDDGTDAITVQVSSHSELGDILVDPEGMTLYMFEQDTQGEGASTCYDGCAETWPPLTVDGEPTAGDDVSVELDSFEREDGSMQVSADGWPLYYFASDEEPGDAAGQGINDVWWVVAPDGSPITSDDDTADDSSY